VSRLAETDALPSTDASSADGDGPATAPLVGDTSLVSVEPWTDTSDLADRPTHSETPADSVPSRSPAPLEPPVAQLRPATAPPLPPVVTSVQRHAATPAAVPATVVPRPTAVAAASAGVQREAGPGRPAGPTSSPSTASTSTAAATPWAGHAAVSAGIGTYDSDGSVVFNVPSGDGYDDHGSVQRSADDSSDGPASFHDSPPALQLVASAPAIASAGDNEHGHDDLDELARRLYGRIRVQLRRELIIDRERAGSLIEVQR
jgi:hypothetical protein